MYPVAPQAEAGWEDPLAFNGDCQRCELHALGAQTRCMRDVAENTEAGSTAVHGGVYLIGETPGKVEDRVGRPFSGDSGRYLRGLVAKHWRGPVAMGNAVRCTPGAAEVKPKHVEACRPYTAAAIRAAKPSRIVVMGAKAALSVLGRSPPVMSVRRGFGWWIDDAKPDGDWVPVFFTMNPAAALRNRFHARQFEGDLQWALTCPVPKAPQRDQVLVQVCDAASANTAMTALVPHEFITLDTETSGVMFDGDFRIDCITLRGHGAACGYTWDWAAIEDPVTRAALVDLLRAKLLAGHNLKYDALAVWCDPRVHVDVTARMHLDTRLLRKLRDGGDADGKLETMAELVGMGGHKQEAEDTRSVIEADLTKLANEPYRAPLASGKSRKPYEPKGVKREDVPARVLELIHSGAAETIQYAYRYMNPSVRARYNARDTLATDLLVDELLPTLTNRPDLARAWTKVMHPAMRALARIERTGILANRVAIDAFALHLRGAVAEVDARLKPYGDINYDSPPQLRELLFKRLGLKPKKETGSGEQSTDRSVLDELAADKKAHPIVKDIIAYRHLRKLQGTYAEGLRAAIRADGRIHTTYLPDGAGSGRISSANPNLQNQPSPEKDELYGKMARNCFCARPGYVLLEADFSQLELRVAAMLSQDPVMIAMFKAGHDFHEATAKLVAPQVWGVKDWEALTKDQRKHYRRDAKTLNFTINYEVGNPEYTVARKLGISVADADVLVKAVMGKFSVLKRTIDAFVSRAQKHGGVPVYIDGEQANWRPLLNIGAQGENAEGLVRNATNSAWNTPVQGTAAHFCTRSLPVIQKRFDAERTDAEIVLTVHDSICAEVRKDRVPQAAETMYETMAGWFNYGVPVVVDFKIGETWGEMEEYKL